MVVDTTLTESMINRLTKIENKYKEKGDANDETLLCNSWKGALEDDKLELERIVTDPDLGGAKLSASRLKEEYPKFRIYTTACLQNAIGNAKKKKKEAVQKREDMDKTGGGGQGLKAKNSSSKKKDDSSVSGRSHSSKNSKSSSKRSNKHKFRSDETMYKCDGTVRSSKTTATTSGLSFAGKNLSGDGKQTSAKPAAMLYPVWITQVEKPVGGALAVSQLDVWHDSSLNKRASVDLWIANGVSLEGGTLDCRRSNQDHHVLVVRLGLSPTFIKPDKKLEYLLPRIDEGFSCNGDMTACKRLLHMHSRYIAAKSNIQSLIGTSGNRSLVMEYRITAPFELAEGLVTKEEDPICYGYEQVVDESTGETHVYFELKSIKPFTNVTIDVVDSFGSAFSPSPRGKSMFQGFKMGVIPENISFAHRVRKDDDSISTKDDDEEDSDDESSYKPMDVESSGGNSNNSEVDRLKKQVEDLMGIVSGMTQAGIHNAASQDSAGTPKSTASTPKKQKANDGSAASVAGSRCSKRSTVTRGSKAREDKRKTS